MSIPVATTDQLYYENPENWGNANVISLEAFIDNLIAKTSHDSYFKEFERSILSIISKQGIKRFAVDVKPIDKAISFQLGAELIFPHPRFMRYWYRISVINDCGNLTELAVNPNHILGNIHDYLQDHEHELLYDDEGEILEADSFSAERGECNDITFCTCSDRDCTCADVDCCETAAGTYADSYVIDVESGSYFEFSEDLFDKQIVIEYRTTGLNTTRDCEIPIHNDMEMLLEYWVKWQWLMGIKNIPTAEAEYFRRLYNIEKTRAKALLGKPITISGIIKAVNLSR